MEKKEVAAENSVTVGGTTLIPVVEVSLNCWGGKRGIAFRATKEPTAVVVVSAATKKAFRMSGEEIELDELVREVPGLRERLEKL